MKLITYWPYRKHHQLNHYWTQYIFNNCLYKKYININININKEDV